MTLPAGWDYGTALETVHRDGPLVTFKPTDLETYFDSPLYAGRYALHLDLDPGASVPVRLNVFADRPSALKVPESEVKVHQALVQLTRRQMNGALGPGADQLGDVCGTVAGCHHRDVVSGPDASIGARGGRGLFIARPE